MGFQAPKTVFPVNVSNNPSLAGLEVMMRRPSISGIGDCMRLSGLDYRKLDKEDVELINRVFEQFVQCLVSWNLTDNETPVPATREGIELQDDVFILYIVLAWVRTLTGQGTDPGEIPMVPPSGG